MDSVTPNYNNESISKPIENEFNQDFNAPIPAQILNIILPKIIIIKIPNLKFIVIILISHILIVQLNLKIILIILLLHILINQINLIYGLLLRLKNFPF